MIPALPTYIYLGYFSHNFFLCSLLYSTSVHSTVARAYCDPIASDGLIPTELKS